MKISIENNESGTTLKLECEHGISAIFTAEPRAGADGLSDLKVGAFMAACKFVGQSQAESAFRELDEKMAEQGGLL